MRSGKYLRACAYLLILQTLHYKQSLQHLGTEGSCLTFSTRILTKEFGACTNFTKLYPGIRKKFSKRRTLYDTNGQATYNNEVIQLSGDVHPNPGPVSKIISKPVNRKYNSPKESSIPTIISTLRTRISTNFRRQACPTNLIYVRPDLTARNAACKSLRNVSLAHLNVRSMNFIQVSELVAENDWDIFTASETWLNSTVNNADVNISGYKLFRGDRRHKRGGGVCAYIRDNLKGKEVTDLSSTSENGFQQLWVRIQHIKLKSFLLCVVYHPPDCEITCLEEYLTPSIIEALLYGKDIIIMGDLNCDLLSNKPESQVLKDLCTMLNLSQIISKPTRVTN